MPDTRSTRAQRRLARVRRLAVVGVTVVVVVTAGGVAWAKWSPGGPGYRTATARMGDVEQTLSATGAVAPVSRADLSFGTSGTVASVAVTVGQAVTRAQSLATLDTSALQASVTSAEAALAKANAQLEADENGQSSSLQTLAPTAARTSSADGGTLQPAALVTESASASASAQLKPLQDAVTAAQQKVDSAIAAADAAVAAQQKACSGVLSSITPQALVSPSPQPTAAEPSTSPGAAPRASDSPGTSDDSSPSPSPTAPDTTSTTACVQALQAVQSAQAAVTDGQTALQSAIDDLSKALTALAQAPSDSGSTGGQPGSGSSDSGSSGTTPSGTTPSGTAGSGSRGSSGGGSTPAEGSRGGGTGGSSGSSGGTVSSAATLASDQASVDSASASLLSAQQNLAAATLVSTIDGTVAAIDVSPGDSVGATTTAVTVVGSGGVQVTVDIPESGIRSVKVGQDAQVTPSGSTTQLAGKVVSVGMMPATASSGTVSYPVVVGVTSPPASMAAGSRAAVAIVVSTVRNVVTVPTSAVHLLTDGIGTVTVLADGDAAPTRVTVGAVGSDLVQISEGITAGTQVVVADPSTPLPGNTSSRGLSGGPGGFVGGPGGFSGGGGFGGGAGRVVTRG